jgi:hypothetical protein
MVVAVDEARKARESAAHRHSLSQATPAHIFRHGNHRALKHAAELAPHGSTCESRSTQPWRPAAAAAVRHPRPKLASFLTRFRRHGNLHWRKTRPNLFDRSRAVAS